MASPGNRPSSLLFFFSCICFFSLQAQQHPFFGRDQKKEKSKIQATPFFNGRVTAPDSIGFGGEPGIVWERLVKEVFPESKEDGVYNVIKLTDGTFAVSGSIFTQMPQSNYDGFVMKVTTEGKVVWKKRLGTERWDLYPTICATPDGGLIATGDFTIDSTRRMPVVKLSSSGQVEWQIGISETIINGWGITIDLSGDGGYLIAGANFKTFNCPDAGSVIRDSVFNVFIKLDSIGNLVWQKKYYVGIKPEGNASGEKKILRVEGGYLLTNGFLAIPKDGPCNSVSGSETVFLLKVDNDGDLLWLKEYGGTQNDVLNDIVLLPDTTILLLGNTKSTNGDLEGIHNDSLKQMAWKLIVNDTGKVLSSRVYELLPNTGSLFYRGYVNSDSTYIIVADAIIYNQNSIDGYVGFVLSFDKNGVEQWRFVNTNGAIIGLATINEREWMIGGLVNDTEFGWFGMLGSISNITGSVYFDLNKNNSKDANEPYANRFLVTSEKENYTRSSVAFNGWFRNDVDTGTYKTTVKLLNDYYVPVPAEKQTTFTTLFQNDTIDFALQPVAGKRDVSINLIPVTPARPGFNAKYKLTFRNNGTDTIPNGGVLLIKDSKTTLVSSLPAAGQVTGDSILWGYAGFKPFDSYSIDIEVKLTAPPTLNNGDSLRFKSFITSTTGSAAAVDLTPADDTSYVTQLVTGAYDPNDKHENVAGKIPLAKVASGENIQYVIRFQNTGTDTAFTVRITDTLDAKLNWNSLQMVAASHAYKMKVIDGNKITWTFDNINLPDSNVNEPLSNGYIAFTIKAKTTLAAGDYFQNNAAIYFDYNLPVITNTATTVVSSAILTNVRDLEDDDMQLLALPNPTTGNFYLKLSGDRVGKFEYSVVDLFGRVLQTGKTERNSRNDAQYIPLNLKNARAGVYYIVLRQKNTLWQQKLIVQ